jgi:hypothetical protein
MKPFNTEIRNKIYELCFVRPIPIRPAVNFYRRRHYGGGGIVKYSVFRYQWDKYTKSFPNRVSWAC